VKYELAGDLVFIGRKRELEKLNRLYESAGFQFLVMYGRRRVGKTTLLSEFSKDKPHIFFVAEEYSRERALASFSKQIYEYLGLEGLPSFRDWSEAFDFLLKKISSKRVILIMDEYPYLASADKSISSFLQNLIDHKLSKTNIFLVICGSSMSFMEKNILNYKSPLYGRKTSEMKVEPFGFFEACSFFPGYSIIEKIKSYGVLGGVPQYLRYFDDKASIRQNIIQTMLNKGAVLYEEPKNLLKQELREPIVYNTIIEAIATGFTKMNEIVTKTEISSDKCAKYINSLINLKILQKEHPLGEKTRRKSIYKLSDNLFKFWYRFIFHNIGLTEQDEAEFLYDSIIEPDWSEYIGKNVFEDICRQYLLIRNKKRSLPFVFTHIGRWWGNNPKKRQQEEIDIIARDKERAVYCECKWRNEKAGMDVYFDLVEKSRILKQYKPEKFMLFSKSGYTDTLVQHAQKDNLLELVTLDDLDKIT
jgi:uncharacterized protein